MKISQDIRREHWAGQSPIAEGMAQKSREFTAAGSLVHLSAAY
ncbi:hypothetical protein [Streptomyces sp. NPDC001348]